MAADWQHVVVQTRMVGKSLMVHHAAVLLQAPTLPVNWPYQPPGVLSDLLVEWLVSYACMRRPPVAGID